MVLTLLVTLVGELFAGSVLAAPKTTITVFGWGNAQEMQNRKEQVQAFEKAHPGIQVRLEIIPPADYDRKLDAMLSAGTAADVLMMAADWNGNRANFFTDLRPYVQKDKLNLDSILLPGIDRGYTLPNGMWDGMPITGASLVIAYNKSLFDAAGVPYPKEGWTWNDLLEDAKKLTQGQGLQKQYGIADHWSIATLAPFIFGGRMFNAGETKVLADDPRVADGIQFFLDLMNKQQVMPDANASRGMPSDQRFFAGKAAMMIMATWDIPNFQQNIGKRFAWDVAPIPADPRTGKSVTLIWTTGYAINAKSRYKDAAWEFVKFVSTNPAASKIAAKVAIPPVKDVANKTFPQIAEKNWTPINLKTFVDSFAFGVPNPLGGFYARINDEYNRTWQAIYLGKIDAATGMKQFTEKAEAILPTLK